MSLQVRDIQFDIKGRDQTQAAFNTAQQRAEAYGRSLEQAAQRGYAAQNGAMRANMAATRAMAAVDGAAAFRKRQLSVQSLDVAQSLALGMPPMMVAIQQGGQLAGIYAGQGGLAGAAKEAAGGVLNFARAHPIATAAMIAGTIALGGMASEIEAATGKQVNMGQVAVASFQVIRDGIGQILQPAIAAIGPWFTEAWNMVVSGVKYAGNAIIGTLVGSYKFVTAAWGNFPAVIGDMMTRAANFMIDKTLGALNVIREFFGEDPLDGAAYKLANQFEGAADASIAAFREAFQTDYLGDFYQAVQSKVIAGLKETEVAAKSAGRAIRSAATESVDPWKNLRQVTVQQKDSLNENQQAARSFLGDIVEGFRRGEDAASIFLNALSNVANRFADRGLDFLTRLMFPGIPSFAGGGSTGSGSRSGGLDGRGGFLAVMHPQESVIDHARGGGQTSVNAGQTNVYHIDARGAEAGVEQKIRAALEQYDRRQAPRTAVKAAKRYTRAGGAI